MAEYITKIKTKQGYKQIDYNALANLPDIINDRINDRDEMLSILKNLTIKTITESCVWTSPETLVGKALVVMSGGGGGGGGNGTGRSGSAGYEGGGGGGGSGFVELFWADIVPGSDYEIIIGAGGSAGQTPTSYSTDGTDGGRGGTTIAFGVEAAGGYGGGGGGGATGTSSSLKVPGGAGGDGNAGGAGGKAGIGGIAGKGGNGGKYGGGGGTGGSAGHGNYTVGGTGGADGGHAGGLDHFRGTPGAEANQRFLFVPDYELTKVGLAGPAKSDNNSHATGGSGGGGFGNSICGYGGGGFGTSKIKSQDTRGGGGLFVGYGEGGDAENDGSAGAVIIAFYVKGGVA